MKELRWNLKKDATRKAVLEATYAQLDGEARRSAEAHLEAAGVPDGHFRNLAEVLAVIDRLAVSGSVKDDLRGIYRILAEAEAAAHGCAVEETHFHEVGSASGVRNALHICLAVEACAPAAIISTPVQAGSGVVQCAHGELPVPAPATAAILARGVPVCADALPGELCTPTSAAIILHFVNRFES